MGGEPTRPDAIVRRLKENRVVAGLVVVGTIVASLAAFTDAAQRLLGLVVPADGGPEVTGTWVSDTLTNPFDDNDRFVFTFELHRSGETLLGSIRLTSVTGRYDVTEGIIDGTVEGDRIAFARLVRTTSGVEFRDLFFGEVAEEEIRITMQSERPWPFPPQRFVARRVE